MFLLKNNIMKAIRSLVNSICILAIAICLPLALSSCNSDNAKSAAARTVSGEVGGKDAKVVIEKMAYHPASITITKGTKVIWTDKQSFIPHDVVSDIKGLFNSGNLHKNDTFSYTFNEEGTFTYYCSHHKKMHGTVIVK